VLSAGAYAYWQYSTRHPTTDNAYVQANVVRIAPLVTGPVTEVNVYDNKHVEAGEVLLRIDPAPFDAVLKAAQARLSLLPQPTGSSGPQAGAAKANIEQAQAAVTQAQMELDRATVKAPVAGVIGKVRIRPGAIAQAGASLFPLVDTSQWWVDANFKETELARIATGQQATVSVDLYPSHEFKGEVDSLSPASGTAFSLLPPENATGNWVKVTQRFPVRISLRVQPGDPPLRVGASASVTVDTTSKVPDGVTP
jgi:membrane fusion protein (multidrug efflux system)